MTIKLELPKLTDMTPRILVIGVGGAGGNAINNMIASGLNGVDFVAANTDAQALAMSSAERRLQLGVNLTEGLGAGANPQIGQAAAEEAFEDIRSELAGAHMVFIAAGMGGGTGTGAAAVIAQCAREMGILTVGIVSKPFHFEGTRRMRIAEQGIGQLRSAVDTLIVIPNQNLFSIATERTTFAESFVLADQVLYSGIACIVDLILKDGLINLDFADVRSVMADMGSAVMGTGEAEGSQRAIMAAEEAIANPLLGDVSLADAQGVLISIVGGPDMTLYEVDEAANRVRQEVDGDANIIVGATFDGEFAERLRVSLVAAGMDRARVAAADTASTTSVAPAADAVPTEPTPVQRSQPQGAGAAPGGGPLPLSELPPPLPTRALSPTPAMPPVASAPELPPRQVDAEGPGREVRSDRAEAFARALEEAKPRPPEAPLSPRMGHAPTWQSAQGVSIEPLDDDAFSSAEGGVASERSGRDRPTPAVNASPRGDGGHAPQFEPAMTEAARPEQPRFPSVDEFPAVGQRAYHAGVHGSAAQPPATEIVADVPRARGGGLFGRLSGMRRDTESPAMNSGENNAETGGTVSEDRNEVRRRG